MRSDAKPGAVLGLIPARGGSKGIPSKNRLEVGGVPLIAWTIRVAQRSGFCGRLVVSTDDECIAAIARAEGCEVPFLRPAELATDTATSADVVVHALEQFDMRFDAVLLLQPTSPLRQVDDLNAAFALFRTEPRPVSVVSVVEVPCPLPLQYGITATGQLRRLHPQVASISRRQDAETVVTPNGAIYLVQTEWFLRNRSFIGSDTRPCLMPVQRSLDIDEPADLEYLRYLCDRDPALVPAPIGAPAL